MIPVSIRKRDSSDGGRDRELGPDDLRIIGSKLETDLKSCKVHDEWPDQIKTEPVDWIVSEEMLPFIFRTR